MPESGGQFLRDFAGEKNPKFAPEIRGFSSWNCFKIIPAKVHVQQEGIS